MNRRKFLRNTATLCSGLVLMSCLPSGNSKIVVRHISRAYPRRAGHLSVNVIAEVAGGDEALVEFSLNNNDWQMVASQSIRSPGGQIVIEMKHDNLIDGNNALRLRHKDNPGSVVPLNFLYDSSRIKLPLHREWCDADLDVQDGLWETVSVNNQCMVRPVPGHEGYDRLLNVTGAFQGDRRIKTSLIYRSNTNDIYHGFGVIPFWGGHHDPAWERPRTGWQYGIAWFYASQKGIGVEFSDREGPDNHSWANSFMNFTVEPGELYHLVIEGRIIVEEIAQSVLELRMSWTKDGGEPSPWITVRDIRSNLRSEAEYAVALVAHRSQVEFGPVQISRH